MDSIFKIIIVTGLINAIAIYLYDSIKAFELKKSASEYNEKSSSQKLALKQIEDSILKLTNDQTHLITSLSSKATLENLEQLQATITNFDKITTDKLQKLETSVGDRLSSKIESLESSIKNIKSDISKANEETKSAISQDLTTKISELTESIKQIRNEAREAQGEIGTLHKSYRHYQEYDVPRTFRRIEQLEKDVKRNEKLIEKISDNTDLTALVEKLSAIQNNFDSNKNKIDKHSKAIHDLGETLSNIDLAK